MPLQILILQIIILNIQMRRLPRQLVESVLVLGGADGDGGGGAHLHVAIKLLIRLLRRLSRICKVIVEVGNVGVHEFVSVLVAVVHHSILRILGLKSRRHGRLRIVLVLLFPRISQHELSLRALLPSQLQIRRFTRRLILENTGIVSHSCIWRFAG